MFSQRLSITLPRLGLISSQLERRSWKALSCEFRFMLFSLSNMELLFPLPRRPLLPLPPPLLALMPRLCASAPAMPVVWPWGKVGACMGAVGMADVGAVAVLPLVMSATVEVAAVVAVTGMAVTFEAELDMLAVDAVEGWMVPSVSLRGCLVGRDTGRARRIWFERSKGGQASVWPACWNIQK